MNVYLGLFLVALSALSLEITLVRLLSVTTWYHLAFFAISTAMLGMTAGAARVYLQPRTFGQNNIGTAISKLCIHFALSIPASLLLLCLVPLSLYESIMSLFALLITTAACALPFFFAGSIVSAVLTKYSVPIGRLYASDLCGASLGCLFVLVGLEVLDAPSLILLCSASGAAAAVCFAWNEPSARYRHVGVGLFLFFALAGITNSLTNCGIRPVIVKGTKVAPANHYYFEKWNSFSRITVNPQTYSAPQYWGPSPHAPKEEVYQYRMNIDGAAGTVLCRFQSRDDIEHLRFDVTNIGYYLNRKGKACIIGIGAGRDIQSAWLFDHDDIKGLEVNPVFIDLLKHKFRAFAGLADRPGVTMIKTEARSYLSRNTEKYSLIQMSLTDTWAATGAGAFSLSENSLYTIEAWRLFLSRLEDNGIFTVSRWYDPCDINETGRLMSLAVASLLQTGIQDPSKHLALITADTLATLLISRQPFTPDDLTVLTKKCEELGFHIIHLPGKLPPERLLRGIVSAQSQNRLSAAIAGSTLNCSPPTDENPYFFNMLRLRNIRAAFSKTDGVIRGNFAATLTLVGLLLTLTIATIATIVLPLTIKKRFEISNGATPSRTLWAGAVYFSAIGGGFMLTEIALIQRLTVFLGHPIYALGILLFTLIASTGIGSLASDRLPLTRAPWMYIYPVFTAGCIIGLSSVLSILLSAMVTASIPVRISASIAVIFPMGFLMGLFFPTGMRMVKAVSSVETPWYWALNGIFGVLSSVIAVLISIYLGISINFYISAVCYLAVLIGQVGLQRVRASL